MTTKFYKYFKQNMDSLGIFPVPESMFYNIPTALGTATTILAQIEKFGPAVTVGELAIAGTGLELLGYASAMYASLYVGAVIGSIQVASAKCLMETATVQDIIKLIERKHLSRPWLSSMIRRYPEIYDESIKNRSRYRYNVPQVVA